MGVSRFCALMLLGVTAGCMADREGSGAGPLEEFVVTPEGASNPTIAVDPASGDALVAWTGSSTGGSDVWLSRWGGSGPAAPVRVNDLPGDAAPHLQAPAQVVAGPEGVVMVLWQNNTRRPGSRFPASDLRIARSDDGGRTFTGATHVNDDAGEEPSSHTFHDLVLMPDGTPLAAWLDGRLPADPADPDGYDGPEMRVAHAHHTHAGHGGAEFGANRIVAYDTCPCCRTELATDGSGTVWAAWRTVLPGSIRDIVVARSEDGGASWSEPVRVHADDWMFEGCPHAGPALAVGGDGRLHVAWYTGAEGRQGLWYAVSRDGEMRFDEPTPLLDADFPPPSVVSLATAEDGTLWAAWEDRSTDGERLVRVWREAGATGRPGPGATWSFRGTNPDLAVGPEAAWVATLRDGAVHLGRIGVE